MGCPHINARVASRGLQQGPWCLVGGSQGRQTFRDTQHNYPSRKYPPPMSVVPGLRKLPVAGDVRGIPPQGRVSLPFCEAVCCHVLGTVSTTCCLAEVPRQTWEYRVSATVFIWETSRWACPSRLTSCVTSPLGEHLHLRSRFTPGRMLGSLCLVTWKTEAQVERARSDSLRLLPGPCPGGFTRAVSLTPHHAVGKLCFLPVCGLAGCGPSCLLGVRSPTVLCCLRGLGPLGCSAGLRSSCTDLTTQ